MTNESLHSGFVFQSTAGPAHQREAATPIMIASTERTAATTIAM